MRGQIEMLRANALGNFRDILVNIAKDTAMLVWLDGRTNTKAKPQENFAREIMELFTVGVGHYTEPDVYAGARVFTGWNLQRPGNAADGSQHYEFIYNAGQHETTAKTFSFPIYRRRQQDDSGAMQPRTACRTVSISSTRWPRIRTPAATWPASCGASSSASCAIPIPRSSSASRGVSAESVRA